MRLHCVCICKADTSKALRARKLILTVSAPSGAPIPAVLPTKSVLKPFKLTILHSLLSRRNKFADSFLAVTQTEQPSRFLLGSV